MRTGLKMSKSAYLFLIPAVALYLLFYIYPFIETAVYSFTKWDGITRAAFIGFTNFKNLFTEKNFTDSVSRIFIWAVLSITFKVGSALIIAFVLRRSFRGIRFFRTVIFFPYIISVSAMCLMFTIIYDKEIGLINHFLKFIGLGAVTRYWLSDPNTAFYAVIAVPIYQAIGYFFVIFLAAMQDVPQELYDAARIDGTNTIGEFFFVTVPYIWGTITVSVILAINGAFNDFNYVFIMTGGGPGHASEVPATYMYKEIFVNYKFGYGSAVALVIFILTITVTMTVRKSLAAAFKTE
ncbi:MAG: sugar ABC transporter permease [Treponema sp.]|nr:sugar ABC transporter permease [Treponema sp.]